MEWNVTELGNGLTKLDLSGRMDVAGSLVIDPVFVKLASQTSKLIVDMTNVPFLASLGIRSLVVCCKALADKGGNMVLLDPQPGVAKVLKSSGISTLIPVASGISEAESILLT